MNLLVISDCTHYRSSTGIGNKNPILCKQFDALFKYFDSVTLLAPLSNEEQPGNLISKYNYLSAAKLNFIPTPTVGGGTIANKIKLMLAIPIWFKLFWNQRNHDLIYLRFPNNLNIISFLLFRLIDKKMFITYTGTWRSYSTEPFTYKIQKSFIKYFLKGPAFVYSTDLFLDKDTRIIGSISPSFSLLDLLGHETIVHRKIKKINSVGIETINFACIGSIVEYKNQLLAIEFISYLNTRGLKTKLKIVGSGSDYLEKLRKYVSKKELESIVEFSGYKPLSELIHIYEEADFLLHTPKIEGYGKTPQEGLAFGVIPILSAFPYAMFFTGDSFERGYVLENSDNLFELGFNYIIDLVKAPDKMIEKINACYQFAFSLTIESWCENYIFNLNKNGFLE